MNSNNNNNSTDKSKEIFMAIGEAIAKVSGQEIETKAALNALVNMTAGVIIMASNNTDGTVELLNKAISSLAVQTLKSVDGDKSLTIEIEKHSLANDTDGKGKDNDNEKENDNDDTDRSTGA